MDMDFEVNMNEYLPLRDVVFNTLRKAILRGELKPGERLMEIQLANKLGVSRTPIREAIRKLELEGLVLMIPRKGAEVAQITEKNMQDVLEVRKALEELSVQLACERITPEQVIGSSPIIGLHQTVNLNDVCWKTVKLHMGGFPSGQRGQTVNLLQFASVVRIHLRPLHI